jgi:hypothetical protein
LLADRADLLDWPDILVHIRVHWSVLSEWPPEVCRPSASPGGSRIGVEDALARRRTDTTTRKRLAFAHSAVFTRGLPSRCGISVPPSEDHPGKRLRSRRIPSTPRPWRTRHLRRSLLLDLSIRTADPLAFTPGEFQPVARGVGRP